MRQKAAVCCSHVGFLNYAVSVAKFTGAVIAEVTNSRAQSSSLLSFSITQKRAFRKKLVLGSAQLEVGGLLATCANEQCE